MIAYITSHASPNHSSRNGTPISMLVLHATVGSGASALAWLTNPASRVSSHYLIFKSGTIYRLVDDDRAAWHAGRSNWHGVTDVNAVSLSIELENRNDGKDVYPPAQLNSCRDLCRALITRYAIERGDVVRHLDIAIPRGRKTDPKGFPNWSSWVDSLYADAPAAPSPIAQYVVKKAATGGASIRAFPRVNAAILGRLHPGDSWSGESFEAKTATFVKGFGSSRIWIRALDQRCVFSLLLERVNE